MSIRVALNHRTTYSYDRPVAHTPHTVRLKPAPHCRTKILHYGQRIDPGSAFVNWQQDPFSNYQARLVFPELAKRFEVEVDLIAELVAINPFDFFLDEAAQTPDFTYSQTLAEDLVPYLGAPALTPRFADFVASAPVPGDSTIDYMVALNHHVLSHVAYSVRLEPGVQTPEETLERAIGSCRDSAWLLVQMLRHMGYASRFVSGYLIQLKADEKSQDGPSGPEEDFTDLHAWCEVYLPGAGWVGLDPTSGLFAADGHIPLAATPSPGSAAPISGAVDPCDVTFDFAMSVTRVEEPPRHTKPMSDAQWSAIKLTGAQVDARLAKQQVRLTVGGEPTFVAANDRDAGEWTTDAVGPTKRRFADALIRKLRERFAPGGALHYGQGKWYPGEPLPRWAFELHWRADGRPLWHQPGLIAHEGSVGADIDDARRFADALCQEIGVAQENLSEAFEDPVEISLREANLPVNADAEVAHMGDALARRRLIDSLDRGVDTPKAVVLPLQQAQSDGSAPRWLSEIWKTRRGKLFLIPGESPAGLRLPLEALPHRADGPVAEIFAQDTLRAAYPPLPATGSQVQLQQTRPQGRETGAQGTSAPGTLGWQQVNTAQTNGIPQAPAPDGAVRTALSIEPRDGKLCIFVPPVYSADGYVALIAAVEAAASALELPVHVEGYPPPNDPRLSVIKVTPDPGVIEVNIQPATSFEEQMAITEGVYDAAKEVGLDASTFLIDGRVTGSGGGNHVVMGGSTPADSPFLRRPDLLASIIRYWQNHPSLSYLFSGLFIGPTSQAPRIDEARLDSLYQMEIALGQLPIGPDVPPWLVDRLFRNLLIDVTGNTHRAEICIDKLYSPDGPAGRLGLLEFRGFEMPPHPRMALAQSLVLRALVSMFWDKPFRGDLIRWGTALHDRFMLPHFIWEDFNDVLQDLSDHFKTTFDPSWFEAQRDFRFPIVGSTRVDDIELELRHGIEPWPALGEQGAIGGTTRFVDSSCERLELRVTNLPEGLVPTVNGIALPLTQTAQGSVAGIRFRAWQPAQCLHPTIPAHVPLRFDLFDLSIRRSRGGCTYHAAHPGGRSHETRPINHLEAEGRRIARFEKSHTPGPMQVFHVPRHKEAPVTLDLLRM